jgi:hypothetical protein
LNVIARDDVTDGPEGGRLYGSRGVHQQLNEPTRDASFDDGLDLIVGTVREVRDGPAGIDQHLVVEREDELGKDRQGGENLSEGLVSFDFLTQLR